MIDRAEAVRIAEEWLRDRSLDEGDEAVLHGEPQEEPFGWVFFYNSRRFLETGDDGYALLGNAPIVVLRDTGEIRGTGTARPLEEYLDEFRA